MNFKQRFLLLFGLVASLLTIVALIVAINETPPQIKPPDPPSPLLPSYVHEELYPPADDEGVKVEKVEKVRLRNSVTEECRFSSCFDYSLCTRGFKVYIHDAESFDLPHPTPSSRYSDILNALRNSRYYTTNISDACLFITPLDTLDRDRLSQEFVRDLPQRLAAMGDRWQEGRNHLVFNMYPGTWPDYDENDLGFYTGKAMLARSSISRQYFRTGFDIAFPLFHREHWKKAGEPGHVSLYGGVSTKRYYSLVFKGKRYLSGIGSETRNSLYHINNDRDIILLTTCKHGKTWKTMEDSRCSKDNADYEKYDYKALLKNSTFCLVPRGRRLGSYRFLEALQAGCIPVILSNSWTLPFSETIEWNKAVIWADERLLLQIPSIVQSIDESTILSLRQQTQFLWETYFSSIDKIVETTLEIIKDRLTSIPSRSPVVWNTFPGGLVHLPEFSQVPGHFPFNPPPPLHFNSSTFTAVVLVTEASLLPTATGRLQRLLRVLNRCRGLEKVIMLWKLGDNIELPSDRRWSSVSRLSVISRRIKTLNGLFDLNNLVKTDAILSLEEDTQISVDEIEFAFCVWKSFQARIVGYPARTHYWDESSAMWRYTSKPTNEISIILTSASFYHRYYAYLYTHYLSASLHQLVDKTNACHDLLLNALISHVTKLPPIRTGQRRIVNQLKLIGSQSDQSKRSAIIGSSFNQSKLSGSSGGQSMLSGPSGGGNLMSRRNFCMNKIVDVFGYQPLKKSSLRFDPLLFKDPVSVVRKKYRGVESLN